MGSALVRGLGGQVAFVTGDGPLSLKQSSRDRQINLMIRNKSSGWGKFEFKGI